MVNIFIIYLLEILIYDFVFGMSLSWSVRRRSDKPRQSRDTLTKIGTQLIIMNDKATLVNEGI